MNRLFKLAALLTLPLTLTACGEEQSRNGQQGSQQGGAGCGDCDQPSNTQNTDQQQQAPDLTGNWTIELDYTTTCEWGFGYSDTVDRSLVYSMTIEESSDGLEAVIATNYSMAGSGSAERMSLTGTFPMEGSDDQGSSTRPDENSVSFRSEGADRKSVV